MLRVRSRDRTLGRGPSDRGRSQSPGRGPGGDDHRGGGVSALAGADAVFAALEDGAAVGRARAHAQDDWVAARGSRVDDHDAARDDVLRAALTLASTTRPRTGSTNQRASSHGAGRAAGRRRAARFGVASAMNAGVSAVAVIAVAFVGLAGRDRVAVAPAAEIVAVLVSGPMIVLIDQDAHGRAHGQHAGQIAQLDLDGVSAQASAAQERARSGSGPRAQRAPPARPAATRAARRAGRRSPRRSDAGSTRSGTSGACGSRASK